MYIFYFDSGTTNSRGYLLQDEKIIASGRISLGSKDVSQTGDRTILPKGLKQLYDHVLAGAGVTDSQISKLYASGMISSQFGLVEVPHAMVPLGPAEMADAIFAYDENTYFGRTIYIIPGAKTADGHIAPDDIASVNNTRGEEVEAMGVKDCIPPAWNDGKYIILFPGSHTHALLLEKHRITDILSNFSGEVFYAITTSTILSGSTRLEPGEENLAPDDDAVRRGLKFLRDYGFARSVYTVHASKVFETATNKQRRDMLSAIITGTVFQSLDLNLKNKWTDVSRLAVYGDEPSIMTCSRAAEVFTPGLEVASVRSDMPDRVCSVTGLLNIIREEKQL